MRQGLVEAIRRWTRPARGQAQVEYTLLLALIAIVASLALFGLGEQIPGVFGQVNSALGGQEECRGNQCGKPGNPDPGPPAAPKPGNPNPGQPKNLGSGYISQLKGYIPLAIPATVTFKA